MIGRLHHTIIDCPDPGSLAQFYSRLLGLPVTFQSDDFAVVAQSDRTSGIGFQRVDEFHPPAWPDPAHPQQVHFDVMVDDLEVAEKAVLALGATRFPEGNHVYADPVGHPFCLIPRPDWAPPVDPSAARR
jgi:catechol 2,3-dioxygenase-like lactoylglutathione lyase family enzyme